MTRRWLIVSGGVHHAGGQDRANLELVKYLSLELGRRVTVVTHQAEPSLRELAGLDVRLVPRPLSSFALGEWRLQRAAEALHKSLDSGTIVLANGGNYTGADVTWVHSLHAVWPVRDKGAPLPRRAVARAVKLAARHREARAIATARLVIANSQKTANDLSAALGVPSSKIAIVRLGADPVSGPGPKGRSLRLGFVGALGWDSNKGLDTALAALARLTDGDERRYRLVVAGFGSSRQWERVSRALGVSNRVEFVGFTRDVVALFRTVDLVISPVRYEAYGLAIQEALIAGVPALVSADAGIAPFLRETAPSLLVDEKNNPDAWAMAIRLALKNLDELRAGVAVLATKMAARSWREMAREVVEAVESSFD
jgi:glycosyltransferase involved in cell wall biosynthesis